MGDYLLNFIIILYVLYMYSAFFVINQSNKLVKDINIHGYSTESKIYTLILANFSVFQLTL
jgi:hypothetical protein